MLDICIQTSYDQNVQLILKSYLPVVYGTPLIWLADHAFTRTYEQEWKKCFADHLFTGTNEQECLADHVLMGTHEQEW